MVPAQLWLTKSLVDGIAARLGGRGGDGIALWLALLIAVWMVERLVSGVEPWIREKVRDETGARIQERVMQKASALDLITFEHQAYYDQLNRAMDNADGRGPEILRLTFSLLRLVPQSAGYVTTLWIISPTLMWIVLLAATPTVFAFAKSGQSSWDFLSDQTRERRLSE